MVPPISQSVVLITGASSGIGLAAAQAYAAAGGRVVLSARRAGLLQQEADSIAARGSEAVAIPADVTSPSQVAALMTGVRERCGGLDILVCNAGVGLYGAVESLPEEALRQAFEVNFFGVIRCIQEALPVMRIRKRGLIQIVSSVIGRRSVPFHGGYCATKFALHAMADALRVELQDEGIHVQMFYPALTDTPFPDNAVIRSPRPARRRLRPMPAAEVARQMIVAARRGARDHVVTATGRALVRLNDLAPSVVDAILGQVMMREGSPHAVPRRRK